MICHFRFFNPYIQRISRTRSSTPIFFHCCCCFSHHFIHLNFVFDTQYHGRCSRRNFFVVFCCSLFICGVQLLSDGLYFPFVCFLSTFCLNLRSTLYTILLFTDCFSRAKQLFQANLSGLSCPFPVRCELGVRLALIRQSVSFVLFATSDRCQEHVRHSEDFRRDVIIVSRFRRRVTILVCRASQSPFFSLAGLM